jgi:hypothetical protein
MSRLVNITLSVPEDKVSEAYSYAAQLNSGSNSNGTAEVANGNSVRRERRFSRAAVQRAYYGGESEYWQPFLNEMAKHPDEDVLWDDLCAAIGLTGRQAAGMIGAAERRLKGNPPYDKYKSGGQHWFNMPGAVAEIVEEYAANR